MKDLILKYIIEQFGEDLNEITYDTSLINGGYIDSFSMVMVLFFLEKTFGIKIPEDEITPINFDTVNKMVELVKKHI